MNFPKGSTVTFIDQGAVALDSDEPVLVEGIVNGEIIEEGETVFVPVFTHRDRGREPTTVYVDSRNVLTVEGGPR